MPLAVPAAVEAGDYTYTTMGAGIEITGYTGPGGDVTIPDFIDGMPIVSIGYQAFYGNNNLTSVTISTFVTSIGEQAFYASSLISVWIGPYVSSIGRLAFQNCQSLLIIDVDPQNSDYSSVDGVLFNWNQTTLVTYPGGRAGTYSIPNSVRSIGDWAFYNFRRLTNITIGYGVTSIGGGAFGGCTSLPSVVIPNSVTDIGSYAFILCYSLTSVTIPNGLTSIGTQVFGGCSSLTSVTIPSSVTSIGDYAFEGTSLSGIYFEGNAPSVSSVAFYGANHVIAYYLPGTTGWGTTFGGRPTALWKPLAQTTDASFGVRMNQFGFKIAWASGMVVVVEASEDLANPFWTPVGTNTLTNGSSYFSDPQWTNYPARFYRVRSP